VLSAFPEFCAAFAGEAGGESRNCSGSGTREKACADFFQVFLELELAFFPSASELGLGATSSKLCLVIRAQHSRSRSSSESSPSLCQSHSSFSSTSVSCHCLDLAIAFAAWILATSATAAARRASTSLTACWLPISRVMSHASVGGPGSTSAMQLGGDRGSSDLTASTASRA